MALIECSKCGNMISDKAKRCPKCGMSVISDTPIIDKVEQVNNTNDTSVTPKANNKKKLIIIGISCLIILIVWSIFLTVIITNNITNKLSKQLETINVASTDTQSDSTDLVAANKKESSSNTEDTKTAKDNKDTEKITEEVKVESNESIAEEESEDTEELNNPKDIEAVCTNTASSPGGTQWNLYFTITNKTDKTMKIEIPDYQYINNISLNKSYSKCDEEIAPGKSVQLNLVFQSSVIEPALIDHYVQSVDLNLIINGVKKEYSIKNINMPLIYD